MIFLRISGGVDVYIVCKLYYFVKVSFLFCIVLFWYSSCIMSFIILMVLLFFLMLWMILRILLKIIMVLVVVGFFFVKNVDWLLLKWVAFLYYRNCVFGFYFRGIFWMCRIFMKELIFGWVVLKKGKYIMGWMWMYLIIFCCGCLLILIISIILIFWCRVIIIIVGRVFVIGKMGSSGFCEFIIWLSCMCRNVYLFYKGGSMVRLGEYIMVVICMCIFFFSGIKRICNCFLIFGLFFGRYLRIIGYG